MNWNFIQNTYSTLLRHGTPQEPVTGVFSVDTEEGEGRPVGGPEEEGDRTCEFVLLYMLLGCSL